MSVVALLAMVMAAGPELRLEACAEGWVDVRQVKAQLSLTRLEVEGLVVVRCVGAKVVLERAGQKRELTLSGATAAQRERTLALFIETWLSKKAAPPPTTTAATTTPTTAATTTATTTGTTTGTTTEPKASLAPKGGEGRGEGPNLRALESPDAGSVDAGFVDAGSVDAGFAADQEAIAVAWAGPLSPTLSPDGGEGEQVVPVELGVVPGVGFNRLFPGPTRNYFALGLIGVSSNNVDGASLGLLTIVDSKLRGLQLGAVAIAGEVQGAQLSPLFSNTTELSGLQISALNRASRSTTGAQLGVLNVTGELNGLQLGLINVADDVTGAQVGFLNIARSMRGTQLGVINVSKNGPAPIGLFNVAEDAPMRLALTLGDTHLLNVALKSGGTRLYGMLSLGWVPRSAVRAGGGLGVQLGHVTELGWFTQFEVTSHAVVNLDALALGPIPTLSLGFNVGYRLAPRFAILLGAQASLLFGNAGSPGQSVSLFGIPLGTSGLALAPGGQFGIEL
jgi:hypothetical protein